MSGPIFDGGAEKALKEFMVKSGDVIGQQIVNSVRMTLGSVLQNPTGAYERGIQTERQQDDLVVNDSGIVYGPWLEGVSSRNSSSRFKGYATFRKTFQQMEAKAKGISEGVLNKYMDKMG